MEVKPRRMANNEAICFHCLCLLPPVFLLAGPRFWYKEKKEKCKSCILAPRVPPAIALLVEEAGKWLKGLFSGKKEKTTEKEKESNTWLQLPPSPPPSTSPKEKLRRSFHYERDRLPPPPANRYFEREVVQRRHSMAVASATEAAVYAGRSAARKATKARCTATEEIAAIKIQASFRAFLARKALRALKGLVKLQALGRGFLVRKKTAEVLRSVQALLTAQARARAQRARMAKEVQAMPPRENIQNKMRELQLEQHLYGEARERWILSIQKGPSASLALTELSSGSRSARFESSSFTKAKNGPPGMEVGFYRSRNYMATTESWRAKVRSDSAPRQRPDSCDHKKPSRQSSSFEGKSLGSRTWTWERR